MQLNFKDIIMTNINIQKPNSTTNTEAELNKSISKSPVNGESPKQTNEVIRTSDGKVFNKQQYNKIKSNLGITGILAMPDGMVNDGSDGYEYFYASTQYPGQIDRKQSIGWEIVKVAGKQVTQFAGVDEKGSKHEHVLMRLKLEDRDIINSLTLERKRAKIGKQIIGDLHPDEIYEKESRLRQDGEKTLGADLNKYNLNTIKQK